MFSKLFRTAIYKGTVNDPTTFPPPSKSKGSYHWAFERLLSAGLVPLTAAAFVTSGSHYPVLDGLLGISLVIHSHIGVRLPVSHAMESRDRVFRSLMLSWLITSTSVNFPSLVRSRRGL